MDTHSTIATAPSALRNAAAQRRSEAEHRQCVKPLAQRGGAEALRLLLPARAAVVAPGPFLRPGQGDGTRLGPAARPSRRGTSCPPPAARNGVVEGW